MQQRRMRLMRQKPLKSAKRPARLNVPLRPLRCVPLNIFCQSKASNGNLVFVLTEAVATMNWEADATINWEAVTTINWAWICILWPTRPLVWPTRPMNLTSLMAMLW